MSEQDDLIADVLNDAVLLGDDPTPQELALGEAVAAHIRRREDPHTGRDFIVVEDDL